MKDFLVGAYHCTSKVSKHVFGFGGEARLYGKGVVSLPMCWGFCMVGQCYGLMSETYMGIPLDEESV